MNVPALIASGKVRISPAAWEAAGEHCLELLSRYLSGDWGTISDEEWPMRNAYLMAGYTFMAAYSWGEHRLHILSDGGFTQTMLVVAGEV